MVMVIDVVMGSDGSEGKGWWASGAMPRDGMAASGGDAEGRDGGEGKG